MKRMQNEAIDVETVRGLWRTVPAPATRVPEAAGARRGPVRVMVPASRSEGLARTARSGGLAPRSRGGEISEVVEETEEATEAARVPVHQVAVTKAGAAAAQRAEEAAWVTKQARGGRPKYPAVGDGLKVRQARLAAGLTQEQLAEQLGVHQSKISKMESTRRLYRATRELAEQVFSIDWEA